MTRLLSNFLFGALTAMLFALSGLPIRAQRVLPRDYFGGISTHTGHAVGSVDSVEASMLRLWAAGVRRMRIELRGGEAIERADSLLCLTDGCGMEVFMAVPDTLLLLPAINAYLEKLEHGGHRVVAYTVVHTGCLGADQVRAGFVHLCEATPGALHGFSMADAGDLLFEEMARSGRVDFMALDLRYERQRWSSLDRVREAIGQVFSRLPLVVDGAVRALELWEKPLLIDCLDYPRDRAFRGEGTAVTLRDNVVSCARGVMGRYQGGVSGLFVGSWMGDAHCVARPDADVLYASDTTTIRLLTAKSYAHVQ